MFAILSLRTSAFYVCHGLPWASKAYRQAARGFPSLLRSQNPAESRHRPEPKAKEVTDHSHEANTPADMLAERSLLKTHRSAAGKTAATAATKIVVEERP